MPQFTLNTTVDGRREEVFRVLTDIDYSCARIIAITVCSGAVAVIKKRDNQ